MISKRTTIHRSLNIPFDQLESSRMADREDGGQYYRDLLSSPRYLLKTIEYATGRLFILYPPTPLLLPLLVKLRLRVERFECDILSHIGSLTLPSLTSLEIRHEFNNNPSIVAGEMYGAILGLLRRSNCSLTHLSFTSLVGSPDAFAEILDRSPDLEDLSIDICEEGTLGKLHFAPDSPCPVLPKLERLTIHRSLWSDLEELNRNQMAILVEVIKSRTSHLVTSRTKQVLKEVVFKWDSELFLFSSIHASGDATRHFGLEPQHNHLTPFPLPSLNLVLKMLDKWSAWTDLSNNETMQDVEKALEKMEMLEIQKHDTRLLMVRSQNLCSMSRTISI